MLTKIVQFIKDIFFPIFCVDCGQEGEWWCGKCRKTLDKKLIGACPVCGIVTDGSVCFGCKNKSDLDGVIALCVYDEKEPVGKLIRLFKYNFVREINFLWKELIKENVHDLIIRFNKDQETIIIPVPLHARRERERGFNQAQLIAENLSAELGSVLENKILQRIKYTSQQARLARDERFTNLQDAFVVSGDMANKKIILVDDVYTTGATMQSCARALKKAGAVSVWGLVLARGE